MCWPQCGQANLRSFITAVQGIRRSDGSGRAWVERHISRRHQCGDQGAQTRLLKRNDVSRQIHDAHETFEDSPDDSNVDPNAVPERVGGRHQVAKAHGGHQTTPHAEQISHRWWQILKMKGSFNLDRREDQQATQEEKDSSIGNQQAAQKDKLHGEIPEWRGEPWAFIRSKARVRNRGTVTGVHPQPALPCQTVRSTVFIAEQQHHSGRNREFNKFSVANHRCSMRND